jgi:hypothetical protein
MGTRVSHFINGDIALLFDHFFVLAGSGCKLDWENSGILEGTMAMITGIKSVVLSKIAGNSS